ncbi:hypothetical protein AVI51_00570 [Piscirickettsia salmonis]|uniref:hypothetical protein n=1 Tax=Piscirickettsia salmonis TaxID=1238 RepID=UPI0006BC1856|nr:hypothetical protein [Piscirickettsia salmonis]ALA24543.1 hypothetical protein KW89_1075 [Piscirickettsia salmonis]APS44895.1 hypothetical protein AVI48_11300 [Piscirickettsia salmonis]APS48256.1 hypothetical protein AVI49_11910 [Piscirickettsia salmonis]APS49519.1 hypothetical protein AVI50_00595 [Piscirickettsia salmonis]APS52698.1 hypothetical protein AVI51_00570 [Piscirickettsia salmonis]
MPRIKPIIVDSGTVAHSYQSQILTTGSDYGSPLAFSSAAIVAQSKRGHGLFHATNSLQDPNNFLAWLKEVKEALGDKVTFSITAPRYNPARPNQVCPYEKSLEEKCESLKIQPKILHNLKVATNPLVAISREGLISDRALLVEQSQKPSSPEPKLTIYLETNHHRGTDRRDLALSVGRKVELTIEQLQKKIETDPSDKSSNKIRAEGIKKLQLLQKDLDLLAKGPHQSLNLDFVKIIQATIARSTNGLKGNTSDTIKNLFKELKADFKSYLNQETWKKTEPPLKEEEESSSTSSNTSTTYSAIKTSGPNAPISSPRQHSEDQNLHYSDIVHSGNTQQQEEEIYANLPLRETALQEASAYSGQEEGDYANLPPKKTAPQGASGYSDPGGAYGSDSQQSSNPIPKAPYKEPLDPNATYAIIDPNKKRADREQSQQALQSSTLFMKQREQNQQSPDQRSNNEYQS